MPDAKAEVFCQPWATDVETNEQDFLIKLGQTKGQVGGNKCFPLSHGGRGKKDDFLLIGRIEHKAQIGTQTAERFGNQFVIIVGHHQELSTTGFVLGYFTQHGQRGVLLHIGRIGYFVTQQFVAVQGTGRQGQTDKPTE